ITTPHGEVPVEALRVGDVVHVIPHHRHARLRDDGGLSVVWLGCRTIDCTRHPRPEKVWPVRVAAHAFGPHRPARDLWLSPDHALFVEDVLIPVKHLINGTSICQVAVETVTYHHVELSQH